jgi:hypothetical protein
MDEPFLCGGGEMGVGLGICSIFVRLCIYVLNKNLIKEHIMREKMV